MQWLILVLIALLIYKFKFVDKIHIILKTFFKKGFQKHDDYFGLYTYIGQQGERKDIFSNPQYYRFKSKKQLYCYY